MSEGINRRMKSFADAGPPRTIRGFLWRSALGGFLGIIPYSGLFLLTRQFEHGPWVFFAFHMTFWLVFFARSPRAAKATILGMAAGFIALFVGVLCWLLSRPGGLLLD
jgi:hypothetical protein